MGIQGLLPLLKSIEKPVHLKDYSGQTLAVDGYVWLHKGAFACAQELCLGQATEKYVTYFMRKIEMFKFFGVKPYVVFDGGYLPSKAVTEQDRLGRREESKKQAMELLRCGKSKLALEQFRKCVDVTPEMAYTVIQALEAAQVDYVVAPYEADAQLAYLEKKGIVDAIVTEDSDLLVFGCKRVIFKLDQYGAGIEILHQNLSLVQEVSFHEWSMTEIRHMCILAGCDYLPSIPGMGLKTSQRLLRRFKTMDKAVKYLRMESTSMKIQSDYEEAFRRADLTFLYARVYDPVTKSMVHLNPIPDELEDLVQTEEYDFLGPVIEQSVLQGIASGRLHPMTKAALTTPSGTISGQKSTAAYIGKENKPVFAYKQVASTQSSKSIQSYFVRPTTTPVTPTCDTATECKQATLKRKPLSDSTAAVAKITVLERPSQPGTSISSRCSPSRSPPHAHVKEQTAIPPPAPNVFIEARSRFFGFDEPASDTGEHKHLEARSKAVREDSGVGLDGSSQRCSSDASPSLEHVNDGSSPPASQGSLPSTPEAAAECVDKNLSQSSEAKVIQGWREKFSHSAGQTVGRAAGLTRAFQVGSQSKKGEPTTSNPRQSRALGSTAAPRRLDMPGRGIVRITPGQPVYHLETPRQKVVDTAGKAAPLTTRTPPSGIHAQASPIECRSSQGKTPPLALNLNRFKYTPPAASQ
ncbi:Rad2 nuclease [Mortierella alpina]|uniref:Rad2 nuclease n=1 Tax=Mortierella alpina TaxID=64518 RepID=A0A9P6LZ25_MORAP|nr:Rad2 nuclease [Mortierella alpina]